MKKPKKDKNSMSWLDVFPAPGGALPITALDFVGQHWRANSVDQAQSDVLDVGGATLTGNGLEIGDQGAECLMIGPAIADINSRLDAGVTLFFEFFKSADVSGRELFNLMVGNYDWELRLYIARHEIPPIRLYIDMGDYESVGVSTNVESEKVQEGAVNRVAVTYGRPLGGGMYRYATSINGGAARYADVSYTQAERIGGAFTRALIASSFGDGVYGNMHFKKIGVYDVRGEADLSAMSA